tara:strand:+ start:276 stop:731 length:456 start_codon:yes stop_codon:yes gene_type:complete
MSGFRYTVGSRKFTRTRKSLKKFSFTTTDATGVGDSFEKAKDCVVEIKPLNEHAYLRPEYLVVKVNSISSATALTIRIATDEDGDDTFFPDTQATISTALTTTTEGAAAYSLQLPYVDTASAATSFYLFAKTDAGSVNITSADLYCTVETF